MNKWALTCKSILAGIAIGLGGTAYLSIDNHVIGALVFSLGLLVICCGNLYLFTGRLCFIENKTQIWTLIATYLGNWAGASITAFMVMLGRSELIVKANALCEAKSQEGWRVILLGILCNILIFFAVGFFKSTVPGTYLILVLCIMAFILCGFEHCIANMFYYSLAGHYDIKFIALNTLGNFIGGFGAYRLYKGGLDE